ncbi:MAG: CidA/LrgA family protein [Chthoniobacteraceae bacterium]
MKPKPPVLLRRIAIYARRHWWPQVLALLVLWGLGNMLSRCFGWPIPGSIVGLFGLLFLLESGLVSLRWFRKGAARLLTHLVLFLVPAMLAVVNHRELLDATGFKLLAAILIGTPLVMLGTALVVEVGFRCSARS